MSAVLLSLSLNYFVLIKCTELNTQSILDIFCFVWNSVIFETFSKLGKRSSVRFVSIYFVLSFVRFWFVASLHSYSIHNSHCNGQRALYIVTYSHIPTDKTKLIHKIISTKHILKQRKQANGDDDRFKNLWFIFGLSIYICMYKLYVDPISEPKRF